MNWDVFTGLLYVLSVSYFIIFCITDSLAYFTRVYQKENLSWQLVSIYRFLRPVRYFMCVAYTLAVTSRLVETFDYGTLNLLSIGVYIFACIHDKDNHGDDPRDKKPSKVSALVKSIGHRLVVVPAKG